MGYLAREQTLPLPVLIHKMLLQTTRKASNEFYKGELNRMTVFVIFQDRESKPALNGGGHLQTLVVIHKSLISGLI